MQNDGFSKGIKDDKLDVKIDAVTCIRHNSIFKTIELFVFSRYLQIEEPVILVLNIGCNVALI